MLVRLARRRRGTPRTHSRRSLRPRLPWTQLRIPILPTVTREVVDLHSLIPGAGEPIKAG